MPSAKYEVPSRGNERLMTVGEWREICSPDHVIEFNDGHDIILIFNER